MIGQGNHFLPVTYRYSAFNIIDVCPDLQTRAGRSGDDLRVADRLLHDGALPGRAQLPLVAVRLESLRLRGSAGKESKVSRSRSRSLVFV